MSVPGPEVVDRSRISEHRPKLLERRGALVSVRSGIAAAGQPDLRASLWEQVDAVYLDAGRAEETDSLGLCKGLDQAASHREAGSLGRQHGQPVLREGFTTDNGNVILDVHNLKIMNPVELEGKLNNIVGVVTNGLFALRPADVLILGTPNGAKTLK